MNNPNLKIIKEQWPICFDCHCLIMVKGFIINKSGELMINYNCGCARLLKSRQLHKYIYGLNLLHGLGCTTNFCECEACLVSYYCITCSEYECNDCSDYHKNHLLSRYKFKYQLPICEAHNEIISLVCMRCSIGICDKCINHSKHNYKDIRDYYEIINTKMLNKYFMKGSKVVKEMIKGKNIELSKENEEDLIKLYSIYANLLRKTFHYPHIFIPMSLSNFMNISVDSKANNLKYNVKYNKMPVLKGPLTVFYFYYKYLENNKYDIIITKKSEPIEQIIPLKNGRYLVQFCNDTSNYNIENCAIIYDNFFLKIETMTQTEKVMKCIENGRYLFYYCYCYTIYDCAMSPIKKVQEFEGEHFDVNYISNDFILGASFNHINYGPLHNIKRIDLKDDNLIKESCYLGNNVLICLFDRFACFFDIKTEEMNVFLDLKKIDEEAVFNHCYILKNYFLFLGSENENTPTRGFDLIVDRKDTTKFKYRKRTFNPFDFAPGPEGYGFYTYAYPQIVTVNIEDGEEVTYHDIKKYEPDFPVRIFPLENDYYIYEMGNILGLYILE